MKYAKDWGLLGMKLIKEYINEKVNVVLTILGVGVATIVIGLLVPEFREVFIFLWDLIKTISKISV